MKIIEYNKKLGLDTDIKRFILQILFIELQQGRNFPRQDLDDLSCYQKTGGNMWLLINNQREIMGSVAIKIINDKEAVLKRFFVAKQYRQQGWGNKLFNKVIDLCKTNKIKFITLNNDTSKMRMSYDYYIKKGFREILRRSDGYVTMKLDLIRDF